MAASTSRDSPGYAVEMDTYNNNFCGDSNANHIAVDALTTCNPGTTNIPTPIAVTPELVGAVGVNLADGGWHGLAVQLTSGAVSVQLDGHALLANVPLTGYVAGQSYYMGFGGGFGTAWVRNVSITFDAARCL